MIYTQIFEAFFVQVKVAFFAAMMLSFPVIANQLWQFVAPGLYRQEKKALLPFLLATPVLFIGGAAMAYYIAVPMALHFLLSYQGDLGGGVTQEALPSVANYLSFVMQFLFAFGVSFLLPVVLMLLERAGIVTRKQLISARRYAIVGAFRDRRGTDAARYRVAAAARDPALPALRAGADRHLVHRAQAREAARREREHRNRLEERKDPLPVGRGPQAA